MSTGDNLLNSQQQNLRLLIKLSVGALVNFTARTGDLHTDVPRGPTSREGIAGHQKIQKARDKNWSAEVGLKADITIGKNQVKLQGRADLVNENCSPIIIEELKTTYTSPQNIPQEKQAIHWAQSKVYAYLYFLSKASENLSLSEAVICRVSWFDLTSQRLYTEEKSFTFSEIKQYTEELILIYLNWYLKFEKHRQEIISNAAQLKFPFDNYRSGQRHFSRNVYFAIREKKQLLAEAPTGTGKTMSTLFPAVKAIGEKVIQQIVYLTAKGSAQKTALNTLTILQEKGLTLDYIIIQAKDKTCPCRSTLKEVSRQCEDSSGQCSRTVGFFDRLPAARIECLESKRLDPTKLEQIAVKHHLCPFELGLQMIQWSSLVICDFNYVLDPFVRLKVFDDNQNTRILLIDEVHNLVDRSRDMYSAKLICRDARLALKQATHTQALYKAIKKLIRELNQLTNHTSVIPEPPKKIIKTVTTILELIATADISNGQDADLFLEQAQEFRDWVKQLYHFYFIHELYSPSHVTIAINDSDTSKYKSVSLQIQCLDASEFLTKKFKTVRAMIGFSATVSPLNYFQNLLGLEQGSARLVLPSVFPSENQLTIRCDYIDTRWQSRQTSLTQLIELITNTYHSKSGKYLIFFPSYAYLDMCLTEYKREFPNEMVVVQQRNSDDHQRQHFLDQFFDSENATLGFAILGGIFGEGVDYIGNALTGVVIVGTGMPQPSEEQKLFEQYLQSKSLNSYQYAYQYPGFTRVKQTAGRVIRSEKDKGIVVLVDPRFKRQDYQKLMPDHWDVSPCEDINELNLLLRNFWNYKKQV